MTPRSIFRLVLSLLISPVSCLVAYPPSSSTSTRTADLVEISQTINLFPILVDSWRYSELPRVFTPDCNVDFGAGVPILHGIPAVQETLRELEGSTSQHALTTQFINLTGSITATAEAYVIVHFFDDKGENLAPNWAEYGKYITHMDKMGDGSWKIENMTCVGLTSYGHDPRLSIRPWGHHLHRLHTGSEQVLRQSSQYETG